MRRSPLWVALGLALLPLLLSAGAAATGNPRLALRVDAVTAEEAVAALAAASGLSVSLAVPPQRGEEPRPAWRDRLDQRRSFDWAGLSFARALRQLCAQYGLRPWRSALGAYTLTPEVGLLPPQPAPARPVGVATVRGFRFSVLQVATERRLELDFREPAPPGNAVPAAAALTLQVQVEVEEGDAGQIDHLARVTARDDTGNLLVSDQQVGGFRGAALRTFPDLWEGQVSLTGPHPKATRLVWVEGDLIGFENVRQAVLELPLPLAAAPETHRLGSATLSGLSFQPGRPAEGVPAQFEMLYSEPRRAGARSARAELEVYLEGPGGRRSYPERRSTSGRGTPEAMTWTMRFSFDTAEPASKVVLKSTERGEARRLLGFRLENIPLPREGAFIARRQVPPVARATPGPDPEPRAFFQAGGGTLVGAVRIAGAPAPDGGSLSLGLARREAPGWGPIRWTTVNLARGAARLRDLEPGEYRVLRLYRAPGGAPLPEGGAWRGSEVTARVAPRGETALPPLEWVVAAPPSPRPAKPAGPGRGGAPRR